MPGPREAGVTRKPNPRCTAFCRGETPAMTGPPALGHPDVTADEIGAMAFAVLGHSPSSLWWQPVPGIVAVAATPAGEREAQSAMALLYRAGNGYHAIADLFGREHEEVFGLLIRDFPGDRDPRWAT